MGISRLKRLIIEDLTRTFDTRGLQLLVRNIDRDFDIHKMTGISETLSVSKKDAANIIVDYFFKAKKPLLLLDLFIQVSKYGFKGESICFNNLKQIYKEMDECGYKYDEKIKKVIIKSNQQETRSDWGYLQEGSTYNFCFVSVDICGNSKLVRKYDRAAISDTYSNYNKMVLKSVDCRKGRIWHWEGDGGLLVFHLGDFVNDALMASIEILSFIKIFNVTANFLGEDLRIRIGINAGNAEYKKDVSSITSDSIEYTKLIEKKHTEPMTISVSKHTISHVGSVLRKYFVETNINGQDIYKLKVPILGSKF